MQSSYRVTPRCSGPESASSRPSQKSRSSRGQPGGGCQPPRKAPSKSRRASCCWAWVGASTGRGTLCALLPPTVWGVASS
eukprot:6786445-Alexandrium_andersonii.AAC.1